MPATVAGASGAACVSADPAPLFSTQLELPGLSRFAGLSPDSAVTVWVYFADKGARLDIEREVRAVERRFSPRAMARRARVRSGSLVDWRDLPVSSDYLQRLRAMGLEVRAVSKWVNAASVKCRVGELYRLYQLPFVRQVRPVASFPRRDVIIEEGAEWSAPRPQSAPTPQSAPAPSGGASTLPSASGAPSLAVPCGAQTPVPGDTAFYGPTWRQLDLVQVPQLHAEGYTGSGVFIGVMDTGFDLTHEALQNVDVVAQWDFINWDSVTANEAGQDEYNQYYHGTYIIGLLAGYKPGTYSGCAFDAQYALAKTEYVPSENPVEEDYWVMGIEWLDSLGVDLVSSSLGYIDWYTYEDMNGDSAVTTIAADLAVSNGVSIFSAMGNEGLTEYPYVIAPADGDSVMSIGGVDSLGVLWPQSSRGPTYDGRIKPEVVAQAKVPLCVNPVYATGYVRVSGTSCATPLAAGACALVLQKNPTWVPMMLREAARSTGTNSASPDTAVGWGIVQAWDASEYDVVSVAEQPVGASGPTRAAIAIENVPNPFNPFTTIQVRVYRAAGVEHTIDLSARIFDVSGRCVKDFGLVRATDGSATIVWDGKNGEGRALPSGVYVFAAQGSGALGTTKLLILR
ncbi:MAG: S8 family serine peptidase [Candidatus Eisenbacteria bacterium]|nr:S8 family serine peptidase [Candidatus Eisenbacteria bacterium]